MRSVISVVAFIFFTSFAFADSFKEAYSEYLVAIEAGDDLKAMTAAEQAVKLGSEIYAPGSENAVNLQYNLANSYTKNFHYSQAIQIYDRIYDDFVALYSELSPQTYQLRLDKMVAVGKSLSNINDVAYRRETKKTLKLARQLGKQLPDRALDFMYQFVNAAEQAGIIGLKVSHMISIVEEVENQLLQTLGSSDPRTAATQYYLAKLYKVNRKSDKAIEKFETVVSVFDAAANFSHPYELSSHANLVELYEKKGQSQSATEHCVAIGKMTPWDDDIEPVPLYRVNPNYPSSAAKIGNEASVLLQFDISTSGFVKNIEVLEVDGSPAFIPTSKKALENWRYAPKFEDGKAVIAKNRTVRLDYRLQ